MLRVIFMGTPEIAVPTLQALVAAGHEVVLVVSQPDRPSGRGNVLKSPPVVEAARALDLPTAQPKALKSGPFPERFIGLKADVAVVYAYGRLLPEALLSAPRWGCLNVHASLLPRWRGAAPIQAALLAGDAETGVVVQRMEMALDTGAVYTERRTPIGPEDTASTLHDRLALLGAEAAVEALTVLGAREPVPQDEAGATWCGKIEKEAGLIDWTQDADALDRQLRAYTPWPGGFVPWEGGPLKILSARPVSGEGAPGTVLSVAPELVIAAGRGALRIDTAQLPGKKPVRGRDLANGLRLQIGELLSPRRST